MTIHQILMKYWGYSSFRPLQEEIIRSVMEGKDTLALLPTGGGKSITFQVPALANEGLCLVISPLISLMKDQVDNLKKRGIAAAAIYSGMHPDEIDLAINKARFGDVKLLYISPERLETAKMRDALRRIKISLLAVDEAHCISQWGYDFRPPYLRIADIRELLQNVPVLALTATATPRVVDDIQQKLKFPVKNLFRKSFERKNLTYFVFHEEDKFRRLLKIIQKVKGTGIVYVRNRRHTKEISDWLTKRGIGSTFYHAGINPADREKRQNSWMKEEKRVIVATNAFGMGIDKPNVRFVVHFDLPDSLEAYFQEAGRAGRDENRSFAVLLFEKADLLNAQHNLEASYPGLKMVGAIYDALGNYLQIPVGGGRDASFDFDIGDFSEKYQFQPVIVFNTMKLLEKEGYLLLNESIHEPSRIFIKTDKETLYRFQVKNETYDPFIKTILRSYTGVLSDFTKIAENDLARRTNFSADQVREVLKRLESQQILDYIPGTGKPRITFTDERINAKDLYLSEENYKTRLNDAATRLEAVIHYATSGHQCRSQALLAYFGEQNAKRCGKCDVCIERNKMELNDLEFESIASTIQQLLAQKALRLDEIVDAAEQFNGDKIVKAIQWLADTGKIGMNDEHLYYWKKD